MTDPSGTRTVVASRDRGKRSKGAWPPGGGVTSFLLVHSPLVGPRTWQPVAEVLTASGHGCAVPSLFDTVHSGPPFVGPQVDAAVEAVTDLPPPYVIAGHSGAGPLLPAIGERIVTHSYLYVDAALPRPGKAWFDVAPPDLVAHLTGMATDGWLPPWHEWFPPESIDAELPDPVTRAAVLAELDRLPVAMFTEPAPPTPAWPDAPCAYLQLSAAYDAELEQAREQGWRTARIDGTHLLPYTDPETVAGAMRRLVLD